MSRALSPPGQGGRKPHASVHNGITPILSISSNLIWMLAGAFLAETLVAFSALAFEVIAARMIAPYAGMSTDTWTTIIAAFLLALALGNWIGGLLATNRHLSAMLQCAALAIVAGGVAVAGVPLMLAGWDGLILAPAPSELWRVVLFAAAPCIPAGVCFGIATTLLMVSVLSLSGGRGIVVGGMYAAGAVGSVLGVLAALWLMLDGLGVRASLFNIGILCCANAVLVLLLSARKPQAVLA